MAAVADQALQEMIAQLHGIPEVVHEILPEIADECKAVIAENVAAQRGPDGTPWPEGKKGQPVLKNAAEAVSAQAIGNTIVIAVDGPEALHHLGRVRGKVKREIIPTGKIPGPMVEAMRRVVTRRLGRGK